ncbi:bifunctional DNA-formamidopyrimidine glycosylase/DNA-(apurinic or apyrimidinic site) lyase [Bacillus sp. S/N-304-OC-R1]|uniref:bifunctional DNA-formamidopyrimidine glycosylase/DNA-(apurinic or apyrimidinic site) lyase n=1 Tax=Bacillus sp. S/N-304-OC-R1 TaxID=2758034 RepID=UPI001C8D2760|nr:bifunctional DNA-formamidopyrimidine glycosylase/DNA-(apurinic or apyrimidinic site) lyase [Bacillus sp. S/N-304-OC-R1]MBY0122799.1 bifunctional DNA-formamidopyrimidine glycosylase/DNA-(apurinic or apyrimidinic site) lyase [Bacillus sp. S/N-304-OC-R1]
MPELPEMETYKSMLQQFVSGKMVTEVAINREKSINIPVEQFSNQVKNQKVAAIERRAKYLIFKLQNGQCLLLHLMLGGRMFFGREEEKPDRTVQVQLSFGDYHLYFIGLRLGYLHLLTPEKIKEVFQDIGSEPLDPNFSLEVFQDRIKSKRGGLKTTLLNQEVIAGIGNRYSDEILWHAQLLPERKIHELDNGQMNHLYESIRYILQRGIQQGGYMEEPLYKGDGKTGGYRMYVHDRDGKECPRCSSPIVKTEISSRKTYFCQNCQH